MKSAKSARMDFEPNPNRHSGRHYVEVFDSWGDYLDFGEGPCGLATESRMSYDRSDYYRRFSGTRNISEARALARSGWTECADEIERLAGGFFAELSSLIERENIFYDVEGVDFDVARVLENDPDSWMRFETETIEAPPGRRIIRIVFNFAASANISERVIRRRGAAAVAAMQLMELAGHGTEVWAAHAVTGVSELGLHETYIRVKSVDQPFDLPRLSFALAHPSMLRRILFSVEERLDLGVRRYFSFGNDCGAMYGYPRDLTNRGDVYVSPAKAYDPRWASGDTACEWVLSQLRECGVKLIEKSKP